MYLHRGEAGPLWTVRRPVVSGQRWMSATDLAGGLCTLALIDATRGRLALVDVSIPGSAVRRKVSLGIVGTQHDETRNARETNEEETAQWRLPYDKQLAS